MRSSGVIDGSRTTDTNAGSLAAGAWRFARGLRPSGRSWEVDIVLCVTNERSEIAFDPQTATRFHLCIRSDEWGFRFCHAARESWIRVTDIPFVHGRDDYDLLRATPPLKNLGMFLRELEARHGVSFEREHAAIATAIPGAEPCITPWLHSL